MIPKPELQVDAAFKGLINDVLTHGAYRSTRAGTAKSVFGANISLDVSKSFPLLSLKKTSFHAIKEELLWFLRGSTDVCELMQAGVNIWNDDLYRGYRKQRSGSNTKPCNLLSKEDFIKVMSQSDEGRISDWGFINKHRNIVNGYGLQWRGNGKDKPDQISDLIEMILHDPGSRRMIVSAWCPADIENSTLPPCHAMFQVYVREDHVRGDRHLDLQMYQRSADLLLGVPFNIASYALLMYMLADLAKLTPGVLRISFGDLHIYHGHMEGAAKLLERPDREQPTLVKTDEVWLDNSTTNLPITNFSFRTFNEEPIEFCGWKVEGYNPHPAMKLPLLVGL